MTGRKLGLAPCLLTAVLLSGVGLAISPAVAFAQDDNNPAIEKVTALNKKAVDAYNDLEFEEARKLLKQALDMCAASGLDTHPIAARTHIHMGVVLIAAKQQDLGIKQFKRALEIQPDIQVTKQMANPEILEAFKEAGAGMAAGGGGGEPAGGGAPPAPEGGAGAGSEAKGIQHRPVARGRRGKAIPIVATIGDDVTGFTKVLLEYKPEGATDFEEVQMRKTGNRYVAEIPAGATQGSAIAYYIEADSDDENADAIATSGSEDHPYNIFLTGGDAQKKSPDCQGDSCEEEEIGPRFFVGLMGGVGFGLISGVGEINPNQKVSPGFASASVAQISPEVGYFVAPGFRLSLQLRYQIVSGATPLNLKTFLTPQQQADPKQFGQCGDDHLCSSVSSAVAVLARASWFFGSGLFRPYFSLAAGGGYIRHNVTFASIKSCGTSGTETCVDTALAGPVFVGPGAGALVALTENFGLLADLTTVVGLPKFTYNLDFNFGAAARF
ncbi:MAG TPA: tetratricopeptide repeat protein [Polyangia bacterium]